MRRLGLLILLMLLPQSIRAAVLNVPNGFGTIQAAVVAAVDGDEIVVAPGTYHEAVTLLGKKITLRSSGGPEVTILDGAAQDTSILLAYKDESLATVVQGFTFRNGKGMNGIFWNGCGFAGRLGGAIYVRRAGLTVIDCRFEDNGPAASGGAIYACESDLVVTGSQFRGNDGRSGGAIYYNSQPAGSTHIARIQSSTFIENTSAFGGGIQGVLYGKSSMTLSHCHFDGNEATHGGGANIYASHDATASLTDNTFTNGRSSFGGGANTQAQQNATIEVARCLLTRNEASFGGGMFINIGPGIKGGAGRVTVANSRFLENVARAGPANVITPCQRDGDENGQFYGGGLDVLSMETSNATIVNCLFARNSAPHGAGASATSCGAGGEVAFINCTVVDNAGDGIELRSLTEPLHVAAGRKRITSSIVRRNTSGRQIVESGALLNTASVTFSNIESGYGGIGNINALPSFGADYRLLAGSPGIDAGDNDAFPSSAITTDLAGAPRFTDDPAVADHGSGTAPIVDMGAYEYQPVTATSYQSHGRRRHD